jgi:hypothetical protein
LKKDAWKNPFLSEVGIKPGTSPEAAYALGLEMALKLRPFQQLERRTRGSRIPSPPGLEAQRVTQDLAWIRREVHRLGQETKSQRYGRKKNIILAALKIRKGDPLENVNAALAKAQFSAITERTLRTYLHL